MENLIDDNYRSPELLNIEAQYIDESDYYDWSILVSYTYDNVPFCEDFTQEMDDLITKNDVFEYQMIEILNNDNSTCTIIYKTLGEGVHNSIIIDLEDIIKNKYG